MTLSKMLPRLYLTDLETMIHLPRKEYSEILVASNPIKDWKPDYFFPMADSQVPQPASSIKNMQRAVKAVQKELDKGKKKVVVTCHAGMHRSPAVIICYLMKTYGMTQAEASKYVAKRRQAATEVRPAIRKALKKACQT